MRICLEYQSHQNKLVIAMETKKTLAEGLTESTQPMLDETAPKFEHKQEDCG